MHYAVRLLLPVTRYPLPVPLPECISPIRETLYIYLPNTVTLTRATPERIILSDRAAAVERSITLPPA